MSQHQIKAVKSHRQQIGPPAQYGQNPLGHTNKVQTITEPIYKYSTKTEEKIERLLSILKKVKCINDTTLSNLYVSSSGPGVMYGLLKVYKTDFASKLPTESQSFYFIFSPISLSTNVQSPILSIFPTSSLSSKMLWNITCPI